MKKTSVKLQELINEKIESVVVQLEADCKNDGARFGQIWPATQRDHKFFGQTFFNCDNP